MENTTKKISRAGIVAGFYALLSLITFPVASGAIQFRASEALCVLPLIFSETVPALAVGCLVSNLITGCAPFDIVFGSIITLTAGACTFFAGKILKNTTTKIIVGGLFPVLLNAFLLPLIWIWCYGVLEYVYFVQVLLLVISQGVAVYALGTPLYLATKKLKGKGVKFLQ
jgi:uncharacterized membrane protein